MARTYARVFVSIWADPDFRALSRTAQALYFRMLTDPKLSMCGVTDWRPNRLCQSFGDASPEAIRNDGTELEGARFVVIDEDTEEALVRSFVRHDGVLKSPNLTKAMASDWLAVASIPIKNAVVAEVRRFFDAEPNAKGSTSVPTWFVEQESNGSESVPSELPDPATCNQQPAASSRSISRTVDRIAKTDPLPVGVVADDFEKWWKAYPKHAEKEACKDAYFKTVREITPEELASATSSFIDALSSTRYAPQPLAFLADERWRDAADSAEPDSWDHLKGDPDALWKQHVADCEAKGIDPYEAIA